MSIIICDSCYKESCIAGLVYCDDYKHAGTIETEKYILDAFEVFEDSILFDFKVFSSFYY